ncbi:MAG: EcsC family protein [Bacillota bacterium]|nr:EcsC family protein [Bacillota bacterium]
MKAANETKEFATDKAIPAMKQVIATTKDTTEEVIQKIKDNGVTFGSEEEALEILGIIYSKSITGIPKVSAPVEDVCVEYLRRYKDAKKAAQKMCAADMAKCTTSGFITGLGGVGTLVITLPANVSSVLYFQIRMIASVARLAGLDLQADATRTFVYACLAGVSVAEAVKKTGITIGEKMATAAISKIPGKTLTAINQKVGFRMLTKFGEKGAINLVEIVPVIGGVVGGGFDLVTTKLIADRAIKEFFDGIFDEDDCIENNVIDAEFETIIDEALQIEENAKQE